MILQMYLIIIMMNIIIIYLKRDKISKSIDENLDKVIKDKDDKDIKYFVIKYRNNIKIISLILTIINPIYIPLMLTFRLFS